MIQRRCLGMALMLVLAAGLVPAEAETIQITIEKLVYSPAEVSAKVGDTIEWINKDNLAHTATVKGGWEVMIPAKKTGSFIVETPGDFAYYCRFHPNMKARLTVDPS